VSKKPEPEEPEPEEPEQIVNAGTIEDWDFLDPRDRTDKSRVQRIFQELLEDVKFYQKKTPPDKS
jgi:hypothetical protein